MSDSIKSLSDLSSESEFVEAILRGNTSHVAAAKAVNQTLGYDATSERSVRRWRAKRNIVLTPGTTPTPSKRTVAEETPPPINSGNAETDPGGDGGTINYTTDEPLLSRNDWDHVFEIFHLDPDVFEIIDDTVRCKTWQQSKALDDGSRDIVQLYSYGCRFRRKIEGMVTAGDLNSITDRMWATRYVPDDIRSESPESTFVVCWADLQLGKDEGGGVTSTIERFMKALDATEARIHELRAQGRNFTRLVVMNMGDPIEGCDQNYAQQTFSVELNLRDQLLLALNTFAYGLNRLAELFEEVTFLSVLCNHGEWQRLKGKAFTNDADNASGFIADALKLIFDNRDDADKFSWVIPRDEMIMSTVLSGVRVAATHGHKMPQNSNNIGGENAWLQNQSLNLLRRHGTEPRLWVTAHRHHGMILDFGTWWRIQCSALDGGSKWFEDASGKWATPGVTTFLVGTHDTRGFSDYAIL